MCRALVLGPAILLAAATAAADTVITAQEIISCRVQSADTNSVRLKLPGGGIRILATPDVYELRLSDSSRVADMGVELPQVKVTLDSDQAVPTPAVRAEQLQQERVREARTGGLPWHPDVVDTLARGACLTRRDRGAVP